MSHAVVIGGGLAGVSAALVLAEHGVDVTVVRAGPGATALTWGCIDVAGASPDPGGLPWRDPVRGEALSPADRLGFLLHSRPFHPYGALFPQRDPARAVRAVEDAAAALDAWLRPEGFGVAGAADATRMLATLRGAVRIGDWATLDVADGDLAGGEALVLAELPGLPGYDAPAAARLLTDEVAALGLAARPVRVERLKLPEALAAEAASPARLAARLDEPGAETALAESLRPFAGTDRRILLPPVLGLSRTGALLAAARAATGAPVAELLGAPPWSPSGLRLDRALCAALERAGVALRRGRVTAIARTGSACTGVEVEADGRSDRLDADAVVLASGRFTGGGLGERDGRLAETLLGLPVYEDRGRRLDGAPARHHLRRRYGDPQPLYSAGVRTDARLRPLDADSRPAFVNLVAAGELVGGFDPALQHTGLGFALLSGRRAGQEAFHLAEGRPAAGEGA